MRYLFVISILAFSMSLLAQENSDSVDVFEEFSLKLDLGRSFVTVFGDNGLHTEKGNSVNAGLAWIHHGKGVSVFRMEFAISFFNGINELENIAYYDYKGRFVRNGSLTTSKQMSFLTFPILYGIEAGRFSLVGGFQFGIIMYGGEWGKSDGGDGDPDDYIDCHMSRSLVDYGPKFTASWQLFKKLHIEGSYYHGLNNLATGSCKERNEKWNVSQITLGIRYNFHFHEPDPTAREIRKELRK